MLCAVKYYQIMEILNRVHLFYQGGRYGKRSSASSEAPQMGVFRPLSSYRESWNPAEGVASSGMFRTLPEGRPSTAAEDVAFVTIYNAPCEESVRITNAATEQSDIQRVTTASNVAKSSISDTEDTTANPVSAESNRNKRPGHRAVGSEHPRRNYTKKSDLSEGCRADSEPSGDSTHYSLHPHGPPHSAGATLGVSSGRYSELESSSTVSSAGESRGMHQAARDTGQLHGLGSTGVSPLSRASSPGTTSSSGSSYNFSSTTETAGDNRGPRATPMGSTTGLLSDNSSSCSQTKPKVRAAFTMRLTQ